VISADLAYPALRLKLEKGELSGGLVSDPSPEALVAKESGAVTPLWFKSLLTFVAGILLFRFWFFAFSQDSRWRVVRSARLGRGQSWPLGQGLPALHDGLQCWVFNGSAGDVRARIQQATQDLGRIFWLGFQETDGLSSMGVRAWSGTTPTGGELMAWRDAGFEPGQPGPLFIEGLKGIQRGELSDEEWLFDLSEMASGPVVLLIPQGEALPKGAVDLHQL